MDENILIITDLPFRKQGNQSLVRFCRMFLNKGYQVTIYTTGKDDLGTLKIEDEAFILRVIPSLQSIPKLIGGLFRRNSQSKELQNNTRLNVENNHFSTMKSYDILPPFGQHNFKVMLKKWISFLVSYLDNIFFLVYASLFYAKEIRNSDVIVGYEYGKAIAAKFLCIIFRKKYINKYQGTVLKAVSRNLTEAKKYYPHIFYGLTKSDLCIMVNDGTDGKFYAEKKGCKKIYFEPHGIGIADYEVNTVAPEIIVDNSNKFILFNNASRSRWKRVDRVIRALALIPENSRNDILLITSYHADDKDLLIDYTMTLGLEKNVIFLEGLDHIQSNAFIKFSDVVVMTNEMSNLGNPALEAVYYGTPVITLDDGSMDGFLQNGIDSHLITIDETMDQKMANAIELLSKDKAHYDMLKSNIDKSKKVFSLQHQQNKEIKEIEKLFYS